MAISSVNPTLPVIAAPSVGGATDAVVLQPGTVVPAQVESVLAGNLVRIAIADLSLDVLSEVALTPGQSLQLSVSQPQDGVVRLQIVGQGTGGAATAGAATNGTAGIAPSASASPVANDPLTPIERIAVSVASETAAAGQQSLAPLFANLNAAAASNNLPPALQQAITDVLAQQTPLNENLSGSDIQNAFQTSGLFLEASLASGTFVSTGSIPDLKAALIVLRQTLASTVETPEATPPASPDATSAAKPNIESRALAPSQPVEADGQEILPQLRPSLVGVNGGDPGRLFLAQALLSSDVRSVTSGAALNLLQEALQEMPSTAGNTAMIVTASLKGPAGQGNASSTTNTPPPPIRGALPSAQPVATATIAPNVSLSTTVHHLLDDTSTALARQTLLQVASLPDRVDVSGDHIDPAIPRWSFEIPFATSHGTAMAQFEISSDGRAENVEAAKRIWQARFSLDIEPAGPVHALISLSGDRTSVRMWAERPQTAAQLRAGAGELGQALAHAALSPGDIVIREGSPPQPAPAKAGHFLDRAL